MAKQDSKPTEPETVVVPTTVEVAPKASANLMVRAAYKPMVDPHTGLKYEMAPTEVYKLTAWVQDQIDSGKLVVA